jgi:hypothetical protein
VHVVNEIGSEGYLCHRHTHYFDPSRPDQHLAGLVSPYLDDREWQWMKAMLKSPLYRREDRALIMSYLAPYTENVGSSRNAYIGARMYGLYVETDILPPMSLLTFWKKRMQSGMHVLGYSSNVKIQPEGEVEVEFPAHFGALVKKLYGPLVSGLPASIVLRYFLEFMRTPFFGTNPPLYSDPPRQAKAVAAIWLRVIDALLPLTSNRSTVGMHLEKMVEGIEEKHKAYPASTWWHPGVKEHVVEGLRVAQKGALVRQRQRMERLREELMMAAWAPTRVSRWVEAGFEFDDC